MMTWQPGRWSPSVWIGATMLVVFVVLGVFGPLIAPYPVGDLALDLDHMFAPRSADHWLGTDKSGIDTLSQLLWGARKALVLSVTVVSISAVIGVTIGMIAGYARGVVDEVIMRVVDVFLAFPGLLLNIAIVAAVAKPGLPVFIAALCANGWVGYARVARGQVLSLRERDYVLAARARRSRQLEPDLAVDHLGAVAAQGQRAIVAAGAGADVELVAVAGAGQATAVEIAVGQADVVVGTDPGGGDDLAGEDPGQDRPGQAVDREGRQRVGWQLGQARQPDPQHQPRPRWRGSRRSRRPSPSRLAARITQAIAPAAASA
jgi:hypothetical protein